MLKHISVLLFFAVFCAVDSSAQVHEYLPAENYGGKTQLREFIRETMVYPQPARENDVEGTVVVAFSVNENGMVENARIKKSLSAATDAEALRLLGYLLWDPAQVSGRPFVEEKKLEFEFRWRKYRRCVKQPGYDQLEFPVKPVDSSMNIYRTRQLEKAPKPDYPGESRSFIQFMSNHLNYPDAAVKQGISGTVELFFVIEPWGGISNLKVVEGVGAGCSEEAIRLIRLLHWTPGVKDGKAVRTEMKLSITFNLADFEKHRYVPASNNNQI